MWIRSLRTGGLGQTQTLSDFLSLNKANPQIPKSSRIFLEKTKECARKESKIKVGKPIRSSNQYSFHKLAKERNPHEMQDKLLETHLSLPERNRGKRTLEAEFIAAKKNDVAKKNATQG